MDIKKQMAYWTKSAEHDLETAETLIKEKKFDWALFLGHLVLEKILKALFVKEKQVFPPKTHNLLILANESGIQLNEEDSEFFDEVNTFNLSTRYPDEQLKFYQLCTKEFSLERFDRIKEKYRWLKEKLM